MRARNPLFFLLPIRPDSSCNYARCSSGLVDFFLQNRFRRSVPRTLLRFVGSLKPGKGWSLSCIKDGNLVRETRFFERFTFRSEFISESTICTDFHIFDVFCFELLCCISETHNKIIGRLFNEYQVKHGKRRSMSLIFLSASWLHGSAIVIKWVNLLLQLSFHFLPVYLSSQFDLLSRSHLDLISFFWDYFWKSIPQRSKETFFLCRCSRRVKPC